MKSSSTILLYNPEPSAPSSIALFDSIVEYLGTHPAQPNLVFLPVLRSENWKDKLPTLAPPGSVLLSSGRIDDWTLLEACAEHNVHYLGPTRDARYLKSLLYHLSYIASKTNTVIIPSADALSTAVDLTTQALRPSQATRSIETTIETVPSPLLDLAWESYVARDGWHKDSGVFLKDGSTFQVLWDLEDRALDSNSLTAPWNSITNHLSQRHAGLAYDYKETWDVKTPFTEFFSFGVSLIVSILSMFITPSINAYSPLSSPLRLKIESISMDSFSDSLLLNIPFQSYGNQDCICLVETAIVLLESGGTDTGGVLTPSAGLGPRGGSLLRQRLEERGGWVWK
ncbi:hypothetical protein [Phaffia rhodozyma]|uniref:Uncharacterized protein n=1 Tax=Phaffia rhodozyma TaxID=264483 RepID=A0A0F7SKG7_PHARH|nr:hypothetical protein [Phaffia rhodozyma]